MSVHHLQFPQASWRNRRSWTIDKALRSRIQVEPVRCNGEMSEEEIPWQLSRGFDALFTPLALRIRCVEKNRHMDSRWVICGLDCACQSARGSGEGVGTERTGPQGGSSRAGRERLSQPMWGMHASCIPFCWTGDWDCRTCPSPPALLITLTHPPGL